VRVQGAGRIPQELPFGTWPSPVGAARAAAAALRLSQPQLDAGFVYWLEGRPAEGGRQTVMRALLAGGEPAEVTPGRSVRSRVHEYGGGDYRVWRGLLIGADPDGGAFRAGAADGALRSARSAARYGDFAFSPDGRWIVAVEEEHGEGEPANRLVALSAEGRERRVLADVHDFVSSPCFSPDGRRLAFLSWEHPDMPWDATALRVVGFGPEGPVGAPRRVAGGGEESIFQPSFSPGGVLTFVTDRSGWWNLWQERGEALRPLHPCEAEFGLPQWALGLSTHGHESEDAILCTARSGGRDRLGRVHPGSGRFEPIPLPFECVEGLAVAGGQAAFVASGGRRPPAVCVLDLASRALREVRRAYEDDLEPGWISAPEAVAFPSDEGYTVHAFLYRPVHPACRAPAGERPPLVVRSHGGPTGCFSPALRLGLQYWTSRGFAVIEVNYAGSSGYGRSYRNLLREQWGVRDVADCAAAARFASGEGAADPARLLASGGSAGGYTTLCLLTFREEFAAGASHYGIGDLEALARDTHKFESRYLERLVGPWPACAERYRARSPVRFPERLARPVIFFQGSEDRVVPPAQTEAMVEALARRGVPHAYVRFEGEGHGFRRAENLATALEGERWFYGRALGFDVGAAPPGVTLRGAGEGKR
jgi:dipeptidyl aminopeptidase/acylaminoacyl peptidase